MSKSSYVTLRDDKTNQVWEIIGIIPIDTEEGNFYIPQYQLLNLYNGVIVTESVLGCEFISEEDALIWLSK